MIVKLKVPVLVPASVDTVKVDVALGVGLTGVESEQLAPDGQPDTPSATFPVKPFSALTVIVEFPEAPRVSVSDEGDADIEKSGLETGFDHASNSAIRLNTPSAVPVTTTRILFVVTAEKLNLRQTKLLPLTVPPGIGDQVLPVQYWSSKSRIPYEEKVFPPSGEGLVDYFEEARDRGVAVAIVGTYHAYTDEQIPTIPEALLPIFRFVTGPMPRTLDQLALHVASTGFGSEGAVNAALQPPKSSPWQTVNSPSAFA